MNKDRILLVDDDEILSKVLADELREEGFDVIQAFNGETGLQFARGGTDLVLLDIVLPEKNGFEVLKELKSSPETKTIPVILLTLLEGDEDIKRGLRLGAEDYIVKSQHAIAEIVEKICSFFNKEQRPKYGGGRKGMRR